MSIQPAPIPRIRPVPPDQLAGDLVPPSHPLYGTVWANPDRLGGTPCFYATRIPVQTLFDYLESGHTLDDFLNDFDGITHEQAVSLLEHARTGLLSNLPDRP